MSREFICIFLHVCAYWFKSTLPKRPLHKYQSLGLQVKSKWRVEHLSVDEMRSFGGVEQESKARVESVHIEDIRRTGRSRITVYCRWNRTICK